MIVQIQDDLTFSFLLTLIFKFGFLENEQDGGIFKNKDPQPIFIYRDRIRNWSKQYPRNEE